jgi:hypothetical protein
MFAERLGLFTYPNASLLVEVIREPLPPTLRSDHLQIAYVVLPSVSIPEKYIAYTCQEKDSVAHIRLRQQNLEGYWTETSGIQGARFGQGEFIRRIGNKTIREPHAFFYFTSFPSNYPVLDQAYQLLGNELHVLLRGDFSDWYLVEQGKIDHDTLDWWIYRQSLNNDL